MSASAESRKTSSLTAQSPAEDAPLNGLPRGHLAGVTPVFLHATVKLGDLLAGYRNLGRVSGQIVPQLADKKKFLRGRQADHRRNLFKNHGPEINLSRRPDKQKHTPQRGSRAEAFADVLEQEAGHETRGEGER